MKETPKERILLKELNPEVVQSALKSRKKQVGSIFMIKRALQGFSPELAAGLDLDLKKMTRQEVMRRLRPTGAAKKGSQAKKDQGKNKKKEMNLKKVGLNQKQWPYV